MKKHALPVGAGFRIAFGFAACAAALFVLAFCLAGCSSSATSDETAPITLSGTATLGHVSVGCPEGLEELSREDTSRQTIVTTPQGSSKTYWYKQARYGEGAAASSEEGVVMLTLNEYEGVTYEEALAYAQDQARTGVEEAIANAPQTEEKWHMQEGTIAYLMEGVEIAESETRVIDGHDAYVAQTTRGVDGELMSAGVTICIRLDEETISTIEFVEMGKYIQEDGQIKVLEPVNREALDTSIDALVASIAVA